MKSIMANEEPEAGPSALDRSRVLEAAARLLADGKPRRAKEIAAALSAEGGAWADKSLVNSVLSREGKGQFSYDPANYTYSLVGSAPAPAAPPSSEQAAVHERAAVLAAARRLMADGQPRSAKEITAQLRDKGMAGLEKSQVNSVLTREGGGEFDYDPATHSYRLATAV